MKLYIKNMVCNRCKMVVKTELEQLGFNPVSVQLGKVELLQETLSTTQSETIKEKLNKFGFELLTDKKKQLTEQIKTAIIELIHYQTEPLKSNLSDYLSKKLNTEYAYLSAVFSETEQSTIEKYFIQQKIEKVKELLTYGEHSLSEIAFQLNYSSVAHLSTQFKKVSGQTPSEYKAFQHTIRKTLDEI
ncbi:helix-turn-helix domain-containing protein [Pedobacter sp. LMG 31464]|uniref:Helix-turn-helix domain-containing protein n=1 Tax=Pedobacter planticolens TaxID=2679964 RepID=A0A923IXE0_9SPHI|nr:AraC family transcriptional regulator [Pedobacter planticolens]MBB2146217.1 helix-turn-helix domain-containing protein [Pedobacter planticolens]